MKRLTHDRRVFLLAAAAALPAMATSLVLLWTGDFTPKLRWTLTALAKALRWRSWRSQHWSSVLTRQ